MDNLQVKPLAGFVSLAGFEKLDQLYWFKGAR
jgi:hypothetical protein